MLFAYKSHVFRISHGSTYTVVRMMHVTMRSGNLGCQISVNSVSIDINLLCLPNSAISHRKLNFLKFGRGKLNNIVKCTSCICEKISITGS